MSYQDHHDVEVLADINAELRTRAEKLEAALKYIEALDAALREIAAMDPKAIRADDLGRAARIARNALTPEQDKPSGFANLRAIMADQPYRNSGLSVHEIEVILANKGGFMPDEATAWFREARGKLGIAPEQDK